MTGAFYKPGEDTVTLWLTGDTMRDLEFILRIRAACVDEINCRIAHNEWNFESVVEQGAKLTQFYNEKRQALEDAEDAAILQEGEDE